MPVSPNANGAPPEARLRITFGVGGAAKFVSHLDLTRTWVRALRRLGVPLAYSMGFNPHPRISVAAPLPVGFAAECEILDLYLDAPVDPDDLAKGLRSELPAGLTLRGIEPVPLQAPPVPSQVVAADYVISFYEPPPQDLAERVQRLMTADSVPFTRVRRDKEIRFDLRPRILQAEVDESAGQSVLRLRLAHGPGGAARPEDVAEVLQLDWRNARATRTALVLAR